MNPIVRLEGEELARKDHHTHSLRRGRAFRGGRELMDSVECVRASEFPQHLLGEPFFSSLGKEWTLKVPSCLSTFRHTLTALTSVRLSRQAGLDSGDLMSCPCPVKALAGWA